jgi:hypothetical protein
MTQVFCPMPWITQSTRNNGDLRICCQANVGEDQGLIRKSVESKPYYYFVEARLKYIPDPSLYIKNRFAGKKTVEINSKTFHDAVITTKNNWVSKIALFHATYYDEDWPEHIVDSTIFTTIEEAENNYNKSQEMKNTFEEFEFEFQLDIIKRSVEDTSSWVSTMRERYKTKDRIIHESRLKLIYFDQWDFRNVGNVYNAKDANLNEARNNSMLKQARLDMLEGIWPQACKRCEDEESAGIRSRMQYENERWSQDNTFNFEKAVQVTASDGSINTSEVPTIFYDLRFGNLCNLKCRMCGPTDSSQWYDEQVKMFGNTYQDTQGIVELVQDEKGRYKPKIDLYNWYENSAFWEQLEANITDIRHLYLVGGEPLMIDQHYEFLQKCIDRNESHHITLEYNTNITNIPERAWDIWKYFEKIEIGASVDGVGKIVEYIRHPAKWRILERNMRRLDDAEGNFKMWLAPTIGILNSRHLPDMIIWVLEQNFKLINAQSWKPPITPHPLHHPKWLNIKILPPEAKKEITEYYEICKPRIRELIFSQTDKGPEKKEELYSKTIALLDNYAIFMNNDDWSELLPKFWELNTKLDNIRGESLENAVPELYNLIKYSKPEK